MAAAKSKTIKVKAQSSPYLQEGEFDVEHVNELNFFDLSGKKAGTKGTSNKMYHAELHYSKDKSKAQIMTMFGPTGQVQRKDYRYFCTSGNAANGIGDINSVESEYQKLLSSKRKKGYKDIDVAQRTLGSEDAKKITKAVKLNNADYLPKKIASSSLNDGQKQIVNIFFGAQDEFIATTLKCPLGQLTNKQIDDGRACLDAAKVIVNSAKKLTQKKQDELLELTNDFYGLIPHNLDAGSRGVMSHLLLDDLQKIMQKEDDLDTLLDAKSVNAVVKSGGADDKYNSLNCDFELLDTSSQLFKFLVSYFEGSKVRQHGYGNLRVKNIWKMHRKDDKEEAFLRTAKRIAKACGENTFVKEASDKCGHAKEWALEKRTDLSNDERDLLLKSNSWLCWHGTRSANLVGITRRGLMIRPSGAVHTGSMYGDGKYFAWQSTKSLNYCDGGYWTGGASNKKYMFLLDVAFGKMYRQDSSHFFRSAPSGYHSVYAKGSRGYGGVMNDEMITYDFDDSNNQSSIKYIFEIE